MRASCSGASGPLSHALCPFSTLAGKPAPATSQGEFYKKLKKSYESDLEAPGGKIVQGLFYPKCTELAPAVHLADVHPVQHNLPFGQVGMRTSRMVLGSLMLMVVVPHGVILRHMNRHIPDLIRKTWSKFVKAGREWLDIARLPEDSLRMRIMGLSKLCLRRTMCSRLQAPLEHLLLVWGQVTVEKAVKVGFAVCSSWRSSIRVGFCI